MSLALAGHLHVSSVLPPRLCYHALQGLLPPAPAGTPAAASAPSFLALWRCQRLCSTVGATWCRRAGGLWLADILHALCPRAVPLTLSGAVLCRGWGLNRHVILAGFAGANEEGRNESPGGGRAVSAMGRPSSAAAPSQVRTWAAAQQPQRAQQARHMRLSGVMGRLASLAPINARETVRATLQCGCGHTAVMMLPQAWPAQGPEGGVRLGAEPACRSCWICRG